MSSVVLLASRTAGIASLADGVARYFPVGMGLPQGFITESNSTVTFRVAGVLSRMYVRVLSNDHTSLVFRVRKNGADANQSVTYGSSETGVKRDTLHTDAIAAGDTLAISGLGTGGTGGTVAILGFVFTPTSGRAVRYVNGFNGNLAAVDAASFSHPAGRVAWDAVTEANQQFVALGPGALRNMYINSGNAGTGAIVFTARINNNNGTVTVSIPAGGATVEDTTHTDTFAAGQALGMRALTDAGHAATNTPMICYDVDLDAGFQYVAATTPTTVHAAGVTRYFPVAGDLAGVATEADVKADAQLTQSLSKLSIYVPTNTLTASSTFTLRKNGIATALTITIPSGSTGLFQDLAHSVLVGPTDELTYQLVTGGTGTEIALTYATMLSSEDIIRVPPMGWVGQWPTVVRTGRR